MGSYRFISTNMGYLSNRAHGILGFLLNIAYILYDMGTPNEWFILENTMI